MRTRSRVMRNLASGALVAGLVVGTVLWQTDDTWPLAQMRMFPGGSESAVAIVAIRADFRNGRTKDMDPFAFHLKRAEVEGQMNRIRANPKMLGDLMSRYNAHVRRDNEIVRIRLIRRERIDTKWVEKELVRWPV